VVRRTANSVAEALGRAHEALLADLRELEQAADPSSGEGLVGLRARLGEARVHLTEHFRFEEENGYMDAVRARAAPGADDPATRRRTQPVEAIPRCAYRRSQCGDEPERHSAR